MIRFLLLSLLFSFKTWSYVPTFESLLRHGSNPEVISNGVSFSMTIKKLSTGGEATPTAAEIPASDYFRLFLTRASGDVMKVAQARYLDNSFSENSFEHKIYYPGFSPYSLKPSVEQMEKGIFFSLIQSLVFNNGSHMVNYLKTLGVPVKLNSDLINREKVEYLASYKRYLISISQNKSARKTELNPLRPEDAATRDRVEAVMNESMYVDTKQVRLSKEEGQLAWFVEAGPFAAVFDYKSRDIIKLLFKSAAGEIEIICRNYGLLNGTHRFPKTLLIRDFSGDHYEIDITDFRHYEEKEEDIIRRLKKWDTILKGKESTLVRPDFLL